MIHQGADDLDRSDVVEGDTFFREWYREIDAIEAG